MAALGNVFGHVKSVVGAGAQFMSDTWSSLMDLIGFLPQDSKILFLGLDNAGKTTLMGMLREDRMKAALPTLHASNQELYIGKRKFSAYDMGGHEAVRRLWKEYMAGVDAILFIVDAADRTRMAEAQYELGRLLEMEQLKHVPFAIIGNKVDIPTACSEEEFRYQLQVPNAGGYANGFQNAQNAGGGGFMSMIGLGNKAPTMQIDVRPDGGPIGVFMVSLKQRVGYSSVFKWIGEAISVQEQKMKQ